MKRKYFIAIALILIIISCSKSSDSPNPDPDPADTTIVPAGNFYKLIRVENFLGDTSDSNPTTAKNTLLYSLENNTPRTNNYQKTSKWDLAFGDLYASFLAGNNGTDVNNYGHGTSAKGGILILKQKFEDVVNIPADSAFKTGKNLIGTDDAGSFGVGTGWYLYDFGGDVAGDTSYDKQHVAYALGNELTLNNGNKIAARTIVVRTAGGNYAKIKMISVYKDTFTRDKWFRDTPHMYFTFEYVMVPKGSTKFEIK
jgi:hypothetical protein